MGFGDSVLAVGANHAQFGSSRLGSALREADDDVQYWSSFFANQADRLKQRRLQEEQLKAQKAEAAKARRDAWARMGIQTGTSIAGGAITGALAAGEGAGGVIPTDQLPQPLAGSPNVDSLAQPTTGAPIDPSSARVVNPASVVTPSGGRITGGDPVRVGDGSASGFIRREMNTAPTVTSPPSTVTNPPGIAGPSPTFGGPELMRSLPAYSAPRFTPFAGGSPVRGAVAGGALAGLSAVSGQDFLTPALSAPYRSYGIARDAARDAYQFGQSGIKTGLDIADTASRIRDRESQIRDRESPAREDFESARTEAARASARRSQAQADWYSSPEYAALTAGRVDAANALAEYRRRQAEQVGQPKPPTVTAGPRGQTVRGTREQVSDFVQQNPATTQPSKSGPRRRGEPIPDDVAKSVSRRLLSIKKGIANGSIKRGTIDLQAAVNREAKLIDTGSDEDRDDFERWLIENGFPLPRGYGVGDAGRNPWRDLAREGY